MTIPEASSNSSSIRALEIAHVLFMDIVAYSQLPMDEQTRLIEKLQQIVRNTTEFSRAQKRRQLLRLPTGDGMALVFFGDAEAPARCALEIGRAVRELPELKLRMGIHTGPVQRVEDINANRNVAGGGINLAQRVMDCGDAGHILISKSVADVLNQVSAWRDSLHDLGEAEVKHGVRVHLYNLFTDEDGNRELPQKLRATRDASANVVTQKKRKKVALGGIAIVVVAVFAIGGILYSRRAHALTDKDTIVLADFANTTGDAIFDDTLKTALSVSLRQSPFLNVLPDDEVAKTLQLMTRPANTKLTPEVARELCQRAGSKAYIAGSIGGLGTEYVLGLKAVSCQKGDTLALEQVTAASKEKVLDALGGAASKLRGELGESLASVQKFDVPLAQETTSSLEALQAFSLGLKVLHEKGPESALPYFQHSIELDPNFAIGYNGVGSVYFILGEQAPAMEYLTKAFHLREHASDWERLTITTNYYSAITGELDKQAQTYQEMIDTYPARASERYAGLGLVYAELGQYEKAMEINRQGLRLEPDDAEAYNNLANYTLALHRLDETRQIIHEAQERKLDNLILHNALYALAFLAADSAAMAKQRTWFAGRPEVDDDLWQQARYDNGGLALAADTDAYSGHVGKARELTKQAVDSAVRVGDKENGALYLAIAAQREAAYGNVIDARQSAAVALKLAPTSRNVESEAALSIAIAGDTGRANSLAQDLGRRFPLDTQMQSLWLPTIHAQLALDTGKPVLAINGLQAATPIEFGQIVFVHNISCLYWVYVRGEAYLAAGQGSAAATEFQKIIDHSGIVWNCWTGALAHLGVARANALQSRSSQAQSADADAARVRALAAYKDFLTLWKDADPDIPILKEAKAEYAKLQ